jgi:Pyridoxamine 5'-phosphate oxidase
MAKLSEKQAKLFTDRNWGVIATLREDGSPHATPVWIDYDEENVLVNSAYGRTKVANIERDRPQQSAYGSIRVAIPSSLYHEILDA